MVNNNNKKKFLITMIIIMACATLINYGLYSLLETYVVKPSDTYNGVQVNIIFTLIIIGIVTVIMLMLIPKDNVNEILMNLNGNNNNMIVNNNNGGNNDDNNNNGSGGVDIMTDEQKLQDIVYDYDDDDNINKKIG